MTDSNPTPAARAAVALGAVADGFDFPTSLTFDDDGVAFIAESGLDFDDPGGAPRGTVWRLAPDGERSRVVGDLHGPVNGLVWHAGTLYVSEGGQPARLSRLELDGTLHVLVEGFPGPGNYHLNMAAVGPDQKLYFSQGAMTNSAIVGLDSYDIGWLRRMPHGHDVPGFDITLAGIDVETADPRSSVEGARATTGAFAPFGTPTRAGQRVAAALPATASIMRCNLDGSDLELVAWGLRNAYGLGFLSDGRLIAIDQGADDRGSRPIGNAPDALFEVHEGAWYGWPDFVAGVPVTDSRFAPTRGPQPSFLLTGHDALPEPERPLLVFPPHVAAVKFDTADTDHGMPETLVVALFGDEAPMTGPEGPRIGRGIALVDTATWQMRPLVSGGPLHRPIDVRVHGDTAYILDFGRFEMTRHGVDADAGSGCLWRLPLDGGSQD